MEQVIVERAESYDRETVQAAMFRLLEPLGGMGRFVKPGERVLLKPNMLSAKPPEAAVTTHPEVVRAAIILVRQAGGIPLVGDSPGIGGFARVAERTGIMAVVQETGAELVEFAESIPVAGKGTFRSLEIARPYLEADRLINLPKLKTHEMMTMTCAVKNLFGAVIGTRKAGWHLKAGADREMFARMLLEIALLRLPDLTIVDAVTAMEGNGPGSGDPRQMGLLLAGVNPVAVDVIAAELADIPKQLLYVEQAARRLGLPGSDRDAIETVGLPLEQARCRFLLPHISDVQFGLPKFLKNRLRHHFTSRPYAVAGKCRFCGICAQICPPHAITVGTTVDFDYERCIHCFCCREMCPEGALGVQEAMLLRLVKKFRLMKINRSSG